MVIKVKRNSAAMAPLANSKEDDSTVGSGSTFSRTSALLAATEDDNSSTRRLLAAIDCLSSEMKRDIGQEALYKMNLRHSVEKDGRRPPSRNNSGEHLGVMRKAPSRSNSGEGLKGGQRRRSSKDGLCNKSVMAALSAEAGMSEPSRKAPSRSNSGESLRSMTRKAPSRTNSGEKLRRAPGRTSSGEGLRGALMRTLSSENLRGGNRRRGSKEGLQILCNKTAMVDLTAED